MRVNFRGGVEPGFHFSQEVTAGQQCAAWKETVNQKEINAYRSRQ